MLYCEFSCLTVCLLQIVCSQIFPESRTEEEDDEYMKELQQWAS
jgi:hypothetical protein